MPGAGKTKSGMGKRRRRPLTQVKSGIALSNLAITAPLPTRLGGPLRRGHSKRSLTRINSKGMEISASVDGLERTKSGHRLTSTDNNVVVVAQESFITSRTARVLLAGAGFLADAYDLFVINLVLRLLKDEYPQYAQSGQLHILEGSVASAALVGSILGQLVAGSLADIIGRKRIFVTTAALITIGCIGSACALDTPSLTIYGQIACWRTLLGAGVGGEYPLAATVTSESTSAGKRGSLMSAVFAMQGIGSLLSGCIVYLCLMLGCSTAFTWRFALAFGAVPVMIAFPYRLRMHETESFSRLQQERQQQQQHRHQQHHAASATAGAGATKRRTSSSSSLSRTLSGGGGVRRGGSKNKLSDYDIASSSLPANHPMNANQRGSSSDFLPQYHHEIVMIEEELPLMDSSLPPPPRPPVGTNNNPPLPSASNYRSLEDAPAPYFTTNAAAALSSSSSAAAAANIQPTATAGGVQLPPSMITPPLAHPSTSSTTAAGTGNFITTADGQYFYQQEATHNGGGGGGHGVVGGTGHGTGTGGSSLSTSLSSSLKPSTSATPIPGAGGGNSSTPPPAISAAVVATLPPAQKAELISAFHAPVTPSSSPVQSLTSQYLDQSTTTSDAQQQQQQAQEAGEAIMGGGHSYAAASAASAAAKAPTTMMDVFRQFHRYRTNSADLTDDYGLYHIDSRHNSSNYSQTMMHMMGSSSGNHGSMGGVSSSMVAGSYGYTAAQQHTSPTSHPTVATGSAMAAAVSGVHPPSPTTATTAAGGAHGSSLMITPMFAKVKSRGLLSKAATSATTATTTATGTATAATRTPQSTAGAGHHAYPAPTSSLVHHRYNRIADDQRPPSKQTRPIATRRATSDESTALIPGTKRGGTGMRRKASSSVTEDTPLEVAKDMTQPPSSTTASAMTTAGAEWMRRLQETGRVLSIYRWHIFGTAMSWFLLDVVFYANGLFNHEVTSHIFATTTTTTTTSTSTTAETGAIHRALEGFSSSSSSVMVTKTSAQEDAFHSILLSMIALPGYILAVLYLETVGRKRLQMAGFFIMAMLFMLCAVGYDAMLSDDTVTTATTTVANGGSDPSTTYGSGSDPSTTNDSASSNMWGKYLFLLLYALTFLFSNFGPNTTSFVIPGEIYPAEVRATCHGLSAASGKLGAAAGAYFFPVLLAYHSRTDEATGSNKSGMQRAMAVCAFIALLGVLVTHFFIPRYDSHTLALADARFDADDEDEEGDDNDKDEEGGEGDDGESEEDDGDRKGDNDDVERGQRRRRRSSQGSNTVKTSGGASKTLKLIVIALDQDCLQTVRENDPRFSDVCLIRHQDDEYCENVDRDGHHHRHYHDLEEDHHAEDDEEDDPLHDTRGYGSRDTRRGGVKRGGGGGGGGVGMGMYRSIDAYDDQDDEIEGGHRASRTTARRGRERSGHHSGHSSGHSSAHSSSHASRTNHHTPGGHHRHDAMQMQEEIHGVHDYAMWEEEEGDAEPKVGHPTIEMRSWTATTGNTTSNNNTKTTVASAGVPPVSTMTVSGQPADHDQLEDDNNDDSDMSDSELYRRLEEARMLYELRERESASSACL